METLCDAVSRRTFEFTVAFDSSKTSYDPFEKKHKLFLICGKGSDEITALHNQLYDGPHRSELNPEYPFQPHMTVATSADRAELEHLDVADIGEFPITGKVRALELVRLVDGTLDLLSTKPLQV